MKATREEAERAMLEAATELFDEVCKADGIGGQPQREGREAVRDGVDRAMRQFAKSVDWRGLCEHLSADEIKRTLKDILRPDLLRMLAPMRPS